MTPVETLADLRESVGHMASILDRKSDIPNTEKNQLRQYHQELLRLDSTLASVDIIEPLELKLYSLIEQYPILRKAYFAVSYVVAVESCLNRLRYYTDLRQQRKLSAIEIEECQAFEENLKMAQQKLGRIKGDGNQLAAN